MKPVRIVVAAAAIAAIAVSASAALSPQFVEWGKGPASFLMTKDEQTKWKAINDDAAAQAFIDLFWARRDPTPGTPQNEFKDQFDLRVRTADERYAHGRQKGSMTDRGKILIVFGVPTAVERTSPEPKSTVLTPNQSLPATSNSPGANSQLESVQAYSPKQLWYYDAGKTKIPIDGSRAEIAFIDQYGSEDWKLERTGRTDYIGLMNRTNEAAIVNPKMTEAPKYAAAAPAMGGTAPTPAAPAAPAGPGSFKTDALKSAVDSMRAATANPYKNLYVTYGEFMTPKGDYFVPLQLYVPKVAGVGAETDLTFFGMVEDAAGKPAAIFEEPAKLAATKEDFFFDKSLSLPPGKYKGTFGLATAGKPVTMVSTDMDLAPIDKDAEGVSKLILSNNMFPLSAAQMPTDPFAFGGLKVVPKSDRIFRTSDELTYFFEMRNPALDPATKAPKIQAKLDLSGVAASGKKVRMDAPMSDMEANEMKGVPGHYAIGAAIPLDTFKPGDYTLKVKIVDTVNNQTYNLQETFKIVPPEK